MQIKLEFKIGTTITKETEEQISGYLDCLTDTLSHEDKALAVLNQLIEHCEKSKIEFNDIKISSDVVECSLLYLACKRGYFSLASRLLEIKIPINEGAIYKNTQIQRISPLGIACRLGHVDIVKLLIKNNADLLYIADDGFSLLMLAKTKEIGALLIEECKLRGCLKDLISLKGKFGSAFVFHSIEGNVDVLKELVNTDDYLSHVNVQQFLYVAKTLSIYWPKCSNEFKSICNSLTAYLNKKHNRQVTESMFYFNYLNSLEFSSEFQTFILDYHQPKEVTIENFIIGVRKFITLANTYANERENVFGKKFHGLHYPQNLIDLWNKEYNEDLHLDMIPIPNGWNLDLGYVYKGETPAEALDVFVYGPTTIDCGMFCQLSILFGIRYMLGNEKFNQEFSKYPLYISQANYPKSIKNHTDYNNSIHQFFSEVQFYENGQLEQDIEKDNSVYIIHIPNNYKYRLKHPSGAYGGENCIVVNGEFSIFDPGKAKTSGLQFNEIREILRTAYNEDQNNADLYQLELFRKKCPSEIDAKWNMSYGVLNDLRTKLAHDKLESIELQSTNQQQILIKFDWNRFCLWMGEDVIKNKYGNDLEYKLPSVISQSMFLPNKELENKHSEVSQDQNKKLVSESFPQKFGI